MHEHLDIPQKCRSFETQHVPAASVRALRYRRIHRAPSDGSKSNYVIAQQRAIRSLGQAHSTINSQLHRVILQK